MGWDGREGKSQKPNGTGKRGGRGSILNFSPNYSLRNSFVLRLFYSGKCSSHRRQEKRIAMRVIHEFLWSFTIFLFAFTEILAFFWSHISLKQLSSRITVALFEFFSFFEGFSCFTFNFSFANKSGLLNRSLKNGLKTIRRKRGLGSPPMFWP